MTGHPGPRRNPWLAHPAQPRHDKNPEPNPPAPNTPTSAPNPGDEAGGWIGPAVDPTLVAAIRQMVDQRLDTEIQLRKDQNRPPLDESSERALAGSLLAEVLPAALSAWAHQGRPVPDPAGNHALREAVLAEMFGLGRLEPLLTLPEVENIDITGCEPARLTLTNGTRRLAPPVAATDEELVRLLRRIAERHSRGERGLNPSRPLLNLQLPGGQRLAATLGVSARPAASIRIHRHRQITLDQLVELGTLSSLQRAFLAAAVRAGKNILIVGEQKAGKTTLLRGMCWEIPAEETLATLETEYEVGLHHFPGRFPDVLALEERQANTEWLGDGRPAGGISLGQLVWQALRMHRTRLIVGEVRGGEILAMLDALSTGGAGALATLHARSARASIHRMVSLCLGANPAWSVEFAHRLIAESIDLIVHLRLDRRHAPHQPTRLDRYVDEIVALEQGEDGRPALTTLFRPDPTGRCGRRGVSTAHPPPGQDDYRRAGFDPAWLNGTDGDGGGWRAPTASAVTR